MITWVICIATIVDEIVKLKKTVGNTVVTIATENQMVGEFLCRQVNVLQKRFLKVLENNYV